MALAASKRFMTGSTYRSWGFLFAQRRARTSARAAFSDRLLDLLLIAESTCFPRVSTLRPVSTFRDQRIPVASGLRHVAAICHSLQRRLEELLRKLAIS